jgi:hypothetical protein
MYIGSNFTTEFMTAVGPFTSEPHVGEAEASANGVRAALMV